MTELYFLLATFVTMGMILIAYYMGKFYIVGMVAACLVLSNLIGPKIVSVFGFAITAGTPLFAALPLATDLITEKYGKDLAKTAVIGAFLSMMLVVALTHLIVGMEALPFAQEAGSAVNTLLGNSVRFLLASPIAYVIWQFIDIKIYHFIKNHTGEKKLWLRNNVSTIIAQAGSTYTFFAMAFMGTDVPWVNIATITVGFYWVIALIDTVIVYLAIKIEPREQVF